MPRKSSAVRRAITARTRCTGESRRSAATAIRALDAEAAGATSRPVPAAHDGDQRDLEARLLLALTRGCSTQLPGRDGYLFPLKHLSPGVERLNLAVRPEVLPGLVDSLVPRWRADWEEFGGVPGLRAQPGRDETTLRTLNAAGEPTAAEVRLVGVTPAMWTAALAAPGSEEEGPLAQKTSIHDTSLSREEHHSLRTRGYLDRPYGARGAHLASSLLRRLHLLAGACWVDAWADTAVKVEWCHGPDLREVARFLTNPRFGFVDPGIVLTDPERLAGTRTPYMVTFRAPAPAPSGRPEAPDARPDAMPGAAPGVMQLRQQPSSTHSTTSLAALVTPSAATTPSGTTSWRPPRLAPLRAPEPPRRPTREA